MIRILIDSTSDMSRRECREAGIEIVPLTVHIGGKNYIDGVDLSQSEFYTLLKQSDEFPKTSQPSPEQFAAHFERAQANGDELICILLSSALSGTCQSAYIAKAMVGYEGVHIIDSLSITAGIRVMADHAQKLIAQGLTAGQIVAALENLKRRIRVTAALDTLEYLAKGGRLGKAAANIGAMFHLKPVIAISPEGTVDIADKQIGKVRAMQSIIGALTAKPIDPDFPIYTVYSDMEANVAQLEGRMENSGFFSAQRIHIGATIGAHVGPGAYGVIWVEA